MQSDLNQTRAHAKEKNIKCQVFFLQKIIYLTVETQYKRKQDTNPATSTEEPREGIFVFVRLSGFMDVCEEAHFSPI